MSQVNDTDDKKPKTRPRKCTLTQQQRNKKRQRATPSQLQLLKKVFETTQTPTAETRLQISKEIDMTERSVQIWFQNKRAKAKNFVKKQENFNTSDLPYVSNGNMMLTKYTDIHEIQQHSNGCDESPSVAGYDMSSELKQPELVTDEKLASLVLPPTPVITFSCCRIAIGCWVRTSPTCEPSEELTVNYCPNTGILEYTVYTASTGFKIELPFSNVEAGNFVAEDQGSSLAHIWLKINGGVSFFTCSRNEVNGPNWTPSKDFSANQQVSCEMLHQITGEFEELQSQFWRLYSFEPEKFPPDILTPPSSTSSSLPTRDLANDVFDTGLKSESLEVQDGFQGKTEPVREDALPRMIESDSISLSSLEEPLKTLYPNGDGMAPIPAGCVGPITLEQLLGESIDEEYLTKQPRDVMDLTIGQTCLSPFSQFESPIAFPCTGRDIGDCYTIEPVIHLMDRGPMFDESYVKLEVDASQMVDVESDDKISI